MSEKIQNDNKEEVKEIDPEIKKNLANIITALLFASDEPLSAGKFRDILNYPIDKRELNNIVLEINKKLQIDRQPFEIVEVAGGFQFRTIVIYQKYVKALFKDRAMRRLSAQALETLAIVAYKQPVSKSEIEGIRNVSTDGAMKTLLERHLIKILGKSEDKPGKPVVYGTTKDFLKYFGLNRISDLPKLEEISDMAIDTEANKSELILDFKRADEKTVTMTEEEKEEKLFKDLPEEKKNTNSKESDNSLPKDENDVEKNETSEVEKDEDESFESSDNIISTEDETSGDK